MRKPTLIPNDARPTALQIIEDEGLIGNLEGKVFCHWSNLWYWHRDIESFTCNGRPCLRHRLRCEKGQAVVGSILTEKIKTGGTITLIKTELVSVRAGAQDFLRQSKVLNVLINNAGAMTTPEGRTKDGFKT